MRRLAEITEWLLIAILCVLTMAILSWLMGLASCKPFGSLTPADHTRNIKAIVSAARAECKLYLAIQTLPRDPELDTRCKALVIVDSIEVVHER